MVKHDIQDVKIFDMVLPYAAIPAVLRGSGVTPGNTDANYRDVSY